MTRATLPCPQVTGVTEAMPSWAAHFRRSDLVLEAIFEDLKVKQDLVGTAARRRRRRQEHVGSTRSCTG